MFRRPSFLQRTLLVLSLVGLFCGPPLLAQEQTGEVFATLVDTEDNPLAFVTVSLFGPGAPKEQTSDEEGRVRFLGLEPSVYRLTAVLDGYSTVDDPNIEVRVGQSATYEITLTQIPGTIITVSSDYAGSLLDERDNTKGINITEIELEKIPSSRDPWGLLDQTPGVLTDRLNVGGNESGQQSVFVGTGAASSQNQFAVDGVNVTDMSATGSSPIYYDFGSFEEIQLTTGGSDITKMASGVSVNVVTKRGTNEWRGSGRYVVTDGDWQSDPDLDAGDFPEAQIAGLPGGTVDNFAANQIVQFEERGGEVGGPLVQDRLWIWGSYSESDIDNLVASGLRDDTILENYAVKLNGQLTASNSATAQYTFGDKLKEGREAGPTRPQPTSRNQSGPSDIYKVEDTQIFGANFYLTGLYSYVAGGFALTPQGGLEGQDSEFYLDPTGTWQRSFLAYSTERPADLYQLDGSYFFNSGELSHELRFGGSYRNFEVLSERRVPGRGVYTQDGANYGLPEGTDVAVFHRAALTAFEGDYYSAWLQDTLTAGKLTANIGLRYDIQSGANLPANIQGNALVPELLPALDFPGNEPDFEWATISPRLGLTYAVGDQRETLLRASYARFAQQMGTGYISVVNPLGGGYAYHFWSDTDGDTFYDEGEPIQFWSSFGTFNPNDPTAVVSLNRLDPDLEPALTDELILGIDHALAPELVVGASVTYRKITDIIDGRAQIFDQNGDIRVATRDDYVQVGVSPSGAPVFDLDPSLSPGAGTFSTNGDREQTYLGSSLSFTKRLADRWMARGHVTWYEWEWDVPESALAFQNPTNAVGGGDRDGEIVAEQSGGSGNRGGIFLNSTWSANLAGLYQIAPDKPWAFNLGGAITAREGFINPRFDAVSTPVLGSQNVEIGQFGDTRNDDVYKLDLRVDKDFTFGDWGFTLSADVFNVTNEATVLQRQRSQTVSTRNYVLETMSPRAVRLGLLLNFR
jgi:hypothetical protein